MRVVPNDIKIHEIRETARKLEEAEFLIYPFNLALARDIRTLEIDILRKLADNHFPVDEGWEVTQ